jgi:hypothetical protein
MHLLVDMFRNLPKERFCAFWNFTAAGLPVTAPFGPENVLSR